MIGSSQDLTYLAPEDSELPGGGDAVLAQVADLPGRYALGIEIGGGDYEAVVRLLRPPLEREPDGATQTLFLDFDGEQVDTAIFGGPGPRTLSPLAAFLPGWGLGPQDEDAVIDAIVASVEENLSDDVRARGPNPDFALEVLNSRDDPDPFGQDDVSRVIVGGSVEEAGILTIGISESVDVGNIAAHQAGHFHTDPFEPTPNLMDSEDDLADAVGAGRDGLFGTADDVDVDLGEDLFAEDEGFTGVQDTLNTVAFGLTTGLPAEPPGAPTTVTAVAGRRSAYVAWAAPDGSAAVTGYVVRAYQQGTDMVVSEVFPADATDVVLEGLRSGRTYVFTVAAVNDAGEGPGSAPSAAVTTPPPRTAGLSSARRGVTSR